MQNDTGKDDHWQATFYQGTQESLSDVKPCGSYWAILLLQTEVP